MKRATIAALVATGLTLVLGLAVLDRSPPRNRTAAADIPVAPAGR